MVKRWLKDINYSLKFTASTMDGKTPSSLIYKYESKNKYNVLKFRRQNFNTSALEKSVGS